VSIENITQKILSEAQSVADSSTISAKERSEEIINQANNQAKIIMDESVEEANQEAITLKNRMVLAAQLESRKMILKTKQEIIKKSFDISLKKLKEMPEERYINFLIDKIIETSSSKGEIILNEKDRKNIGEKIIKIANEKIKDGKMVLSSKTIHASGGFVLKNGDIEVNSTFETILDTVKEGLTFEVANALFK
jgi:V/A-type H+/Na+-transporting ATPase subunit E